MCQLKKKSEFFFNTKTVLNICVYRSQERIGVSKLVHDSDDDDLSGEALMDCVHFDIEVVAVNGMLGRRVPMALFEHVLCSIYVNIPSLT